MKIPIIILAVFCSLAVVAQADYRIRIDHNSYKDDFENLTASQIQNVSENFNLVYMAPSHGKPILEGMRILSH